jgi:hypothetical protein
MSIVVAFLIVLGLTGPVPANTVGGGPGMAVAADTVGGGPGIVSPGTDNTVGGGPGK